MPKTRIYQCPSCGELIPTKREKGYIKCSCGNKGEIRRHIVKTAQLTKAQQEKITEAPRKKEAKAAPTAAPAMPGGEDPRFHIQSQQKGDAMTKGKDKDTQDPAQDKDEYGCADCKQPIKQGQKHCPSCGVQLDWSAIAG